MIPDNALGDRLNDVKDGIKPLIPQNQDLFIEKLIKTEQSTNNKISILMNIGIAAINIVDVLIVSLLYGYASKGLITTFSTIEWGFLEILGIGFALNTFFSYIPKLISKIFKSSVS